MRHANVQIQIDQRDQSAAAVTVSGHLDRDTVMDAHKQLSRLNGSHRVDVDLSGVDHIDSTGAAFLAEFVLGCEQRQRTVALTGANDRVREALDLFTLPEPSASEPTRPMGLVERAGAAAIDRARGFVDFVVLVADAAALSVRADRRTKRARKGFFGLECVRLGVSTLPILGMAGLLFGIVIGLQSAYTLRDFGATKLVADLVVLSILREIGPFITAAIVLSRNGSAIAAEIATMRVGEETDALRTMGLNPVGFAVVPKLQAMTFAVPALTIYAGLMGILGGMLVGYVGLGVGPAAFIERALYVVDGVDVYSGLIKSVTFAWIITLVSAYEGSKADGGPQSVGTATTGAVVRSFFWVIVVDAGFSAIFFYA